MFGKSVAFAQCFALPVNSVHLLATSRGQSKRIQSELMLTSLTLDNAAHSQTPKKVRGSLAKAKLLLSLRLCELRSLALRANECNESSITAR